MTQAQVAELTGVHKNSQGNYENNTKFPDSKYLATLSDSGFDILYIVAGSRTPDVGDISSDELELIKIYRAAPLAVKAAALAALMAGSSASTGSINVTGSGQRVAGRDYHEGKK
ncbi:helix-turn-helix transcriptional regulator [Dickeya zeae]|nr:helix-turn-helix transcriptional regulator [Dickeya zeae]